MQSDYHLDVNSLRAGSIAASVSFLQQLPDDIRERLIASGRRIDFARGAIIQQRGDAGDFFWYIVSGRVQVGRYSDDGRWRIFAILEGGQSFGEQAFLGSFPRMVDAIAGSDAELVRIGEKELANLLESRVGAARILLRAMANMVHAAFDLVESGRLPTARERLANVINTIGEGKPRPAEISVTQQELADLSGLSRVTVGKELQRLVENGDIQLGYGKITINRVPETSA